MRQPAATRRDSLRGLLVPIAGASILHPAARCAEWAQAITRRAHQPDLVIEHVEKYPRVDRHSGGTGASSSRRVISDTIVSMGSVREGIRARQKPARDSGALPGELDMFSRTCRPFLIATFLLIGCRPFVQAQTAAVRAFEAASIKPSAPDARGTAIARPPGRLEIGNMTLKEMIANAYSVQPFQVSGGPGWVDSVHYDISAKAGAQVSREEVLLMLQALLADRFHLAFRRETHQLPVFALVLARKDGKPGPRLIPSKEGACTPFDPAKPFAVDNMRLCGAFSLGPDVLTLVGGSIASLTPRLSRLLGRVVIDRTGLTRNFDINIEWSPDETLAMQAANRGTVDNIGATIFTVFGQDLGLDFKAEKGPVEILNIERAEKLSGN